MLPFYNKRVKKSITMAVLAVLFVFPVFPVWAAAPNDVLYASQASFWNQIGAPGAWDIITESAAVVAIIDTNIDINNPDLKENIWINSNEIANNGIDDDENGYIDDVNGWDFVDNDNTPGAASEKSLFSDESTRSHGTAIAGLIGARGNNGLYGTGLNWQVKIMPLRAINSDGAGYYRDIALAVDYAVDNGASVINISFTGETLGEELENALRRAYEKGVLIVVAVGNSRIAGKGDMDVWPIYPACSDAFEDENWILGVTSVGPTDTLSAFANYGRGVDLSAPGEFIYSTEVYTAANNYRGFSGYWRGTSFASPLVAGAAALIKGLKPDWTAKEIMETLLASADDIDANNPGFSGRMGYGRLNLTAAITRALESGGNLTGGKVCYSSGTKFFCYNYGSKKLLYLANVGSTILDLTWLGDDRVGVLNVSGDNRKFSVYSGDGFPVSSFIVPSNVSKASFFENNGKTMIMTAAFTNGKTEFSVYDSKGNVDKKFILSGDRRFFFAKNEKIYSPIIKNNKLVFSIFDFSGKLLDEIIGPTAVKILDFQAGAFMQPGIQGAVLTLLGNEHYRVVVDAETNSFISERVEANSEKLLIKDMNLDGLQEVAAYRSVGGTFDFFTARGKKAGNVVLPALK